MMEENFALAWEDGGTTVVETEEEVICDYAGDILENETVEQTVTTDVVEEIVGGDDVGEEVEVSNTVQMNEEDVEEEEEDVNAEAAEGDDGLVYLTDPNVLVMQTGNDTDGYVCEVSEEVITDQWAGECPEEIVIGNEEAVGDVNEQTNDDFDIPLPTDQDEYTASRPYPCDFCSRRFRKKANLMNHMIAHQTDRPHGCNLCGVRYIRKQDLMNHLKIHAFVPESDALEEDEMPSSDAVADEEKFRARRKRRRQKFKMEMDDEQESIGASGAGEEASSSKAYNYVEEDIRMMEVTSNNVKSDYNGFLENSEVRYPIVDPRKPFVCQHCGVGFAREKALASHSRVHGGDSPFECQRCNEMFWDMAALRDHNRSKHNNLGNYDDDEDEDDDDDDDDDDYSEEDTKYGTFYCSTCGLSFHRQDNLKRHQRVHIKEELINHTTHTFTHVCNVCGESFSEALDLLAHAEVHARGSEYRCMICGEVCPDESSVGLHVQTKHGKNLPPNTCMLCGRTCKDRRTLLKHSWEHSKEKMFACSKCAKTFHNKARLKRHMLSHRNKIVACDVCGEEFPDGRSLMNHRHSHSSLSGRQFPCRECGKTFGSRSSQQIHIRIHTGERPYGCRFCWKAFADGGTLRKHERIHTGEKPYACAVCPRAFNQRVVLREHIRSHHSGPDPKYTNTVTPYCCSVCWDLFATSQDLIVHLIHHCDMNTAMKRQPQIGPRKYKRRRKLKPHELELISNKVEEESGRREQPPDDDDEDEDDDMFSDSDDERERRKKTKKYKRSPVKNEPYEEYPATTEKPAGNAAPKGAKKKKVAAVVPSRPKMIHTQKTRVAVETGEDGRVRHKTKTLVTRTQPVEVKSDRVRPRTKNVSYHIFNQDKLPLATFPDDTEQAVSNLLKEEETTTASYIPTSNGDGNGFEEDCQPPEVAVEQVVETDDVPIPMNIIKVTTKPLALTPGRHVIGPDSKVVRIVKGGMIITKNKSKNGKGSDHLEPESILPDLEPPGNSIKQEVKQETSDADPSPLRELAELSMQHAQQQHQKGEKDKGPVVYKCEMCSAVFSDRGKLLDHVPIHI